MDPIIQGFQLRRKELEAELKRIDRAEQAYNQDASVSTFNLDNYKLQIAAFIKDNDVPTGLRAQEVAKGLGIPQADYSILQFLRKDKHFKQVNSGKRNQRFRFAELVKTETKPTPKVEKVREASQKVGTKYKSQAKGASKKRKTQPKRTSGNRIASGLGKETRDAILEVLKKRKQVTARIIAEETGLPKDRVSKHLNQLVDAETVKNLGRDPNHKAFINGQAQGIAPFVYESLIFEAPASNASMHVSASSKPDTVNIW
jgi:response regulator of citrate/malate metabolism